MKDIQTKRDRAIFEAGLDRRAFMGRLGMAAGMGAVAYHVPGVFSIKPVEAAAMEPARATPVTSVFMDMPWVDMTGRAEPYVAPREMNISVRLRLGEDFGNYQYYYV